MPHDAPAAATGARVARRLSVTGRVQGVGFRPFVWRLATREGIAGWVRNAGGRVDIHAEGPAEALDRFAAALIAAAPPLARPKAGPVAPAAPTGARDFAIRASDAGAGVQAHIPPDLFTCDDCLAEMADPAARRFRYPFTNCTQCGPRYTIIRALPYDRPATTMADFPMCPDCAADYADPADRRFHAQPLACPVCGPRLWFEGPAGRIDGAEAALAATLACLRGGGIVAAKGIGGYHLLCDAANPDAVAALRARKHRPAKPLAVMYPQAGADGLDALRRDLAPCPVAAAALADPARPIVLCTARPDSRLAPGIAPGLAEVGAFLPYSPLHHLLLGDFGGPLVATSANLSGEPVLTDPEAVRTRLSAVADAMLHHDRPIARPADDSVLRPIAGAARPIRLGRGAAPVEIALPGRLTLPLIATAGQGKAAPALAWGDRALIAPHVGDLDSPRALDIFAAVIDDLARLYRVAPERIAHDAHAGYAGTRWAATRGLPRLPVWHHHAHASALALEAPEVRDWLVLAWDAVGLGPDGTLWGGEALAGRPGAWRPAAGLRRFAPPGGEAAARAPWRSAAALVWATGRELPRPPDGAALARGAWERRLNCPETGAVGRLLDGLACLILGLDTVSHEGEAPMALEAAAAGGRAREVALPLAPDPAGLPRADWAGLVAYALDSDDNPRDKAATVHASLADLAARIAATAPGAAVGFTGGVAQNRLLAEALAARLEGAGRPLHLPRLAPANDGGLALGQIAEILARDGAVPAWTDTKETR